MTTTRTAADQLAAVATEQAGEIDRLESENAAFRAKAEECFREQHAQNMKLVGQLAAMKNANESLTLSLRLANQEIERLKAGRLA